MTKVPKTAVKPFLRGNSGALCYALFERCLSPLRTSDTTTTKNRAAARYREEPSDRIRIKGRDQTTDYNPHKETR